MTTTLDRPAAAFDDAPTTATTATMKAIVQPGYGPFDILRFEEVPRPVPTAQQVLVRVRAASVNAADYHRVTAKIPLIRAMEGIRRPRNRLVGSDVAGVVEEVGSEVTHLKPGDEVYGTSRGAYAEYVAGTTFVPKPANLSFEEAAAIPLAATTALQAVRDQGKVEPGQRVLVNGAGGGVGTFIVQIAKAFGAEVTATTNPANVERLRSLGADEVMDYTRADFTRTGGKWDIIAEVGGRPSLGRILRALSPGGTLVLVGAGRGFGGPLVRVVAAAFRSAVLRQPIKVFMATETREDLLALNELIAAGKVRPLIDRRYPLAEVPAALEYVEGNRALGKVVITI